MKNLLSHDFLTCQRNCVEMFSIFVSERATPGRTSILVVVGGTVEYEGSKSKIFSQNFVLTAEGKVWKVVSDCFRLIS